MSDEQAALEEIICWHKFLYYTKGAPSISDYQYDMLERDLQARFPDSPVLTETKYMECPPEFWPYFEALYKADSSPSAPPAPAPGAL